MMYSHHSVNITCINLSTYYSLITLAYTRNAPIQSKWLGVVREGGSLCPQNQR